jgi:hypothetical protein
METVSRYLQYLLFVVGELRGDRIKPPSKDKTPKITNNYSG